MQIEQLEQHVEDLNLDEIKSSSDAAMATNDPSQILPKICEIYWKVRPILEHVSNWFFIPKKIRDVVKTFIGVMDGVCPAT